MTFLTDLLRLFYPELCINCNNILTNNENLICTFCRHDLPLTHYKNYSDNKVVKIFNGRVTIENAHALLLFKKEGITKKIIHHLKYKGNQKVGVFFGNWLGSVLKEDSGFSKIDYIIPVPIHKNKLKKRGYNQVSKFGQRLSIHFKKEFLENLLIRDSMTTTQTFKSRLDRFKNTETKFSLNKSLNTEKYKNKHFLVIDDVVTTGATLEACAKELQKIEGAKISILTIAYTE